jgi:hypothetical protein
MSISSLEFITNNHEKENFIFAFYGSIISHGVLNSRKWSIGRKRAQHGMFFFVNAFHTGWLRRGGGRAGDSLSGYQTDSSGE